MQISMSKVKAKVTGSKVKVTA